MGFACSVGAGRPSPGLDPIHEQREGDDGERHEAQKDASRDPGHGDWLLSQPSSSRIVQIAVEPGLKAALSGLHQKLASCQYA
jgi:hypothetical protein